MLCRILELSHDVPTTGYIVKKYLTTDMTWDLVTIWKK